MLRSRWACFVLIGMMLASPSAIWGAAEPIARDRLVAEHVSTGRAWTLSDIISAPTISDLAVSQDGAHALYIARRADPGRDAKISTLHVVDLASGVDAALRSSRWMTGLSAAKGEAGWTLIADIGLGAQLYHVSSEGKFTALVVNPTPAPDFGAANEARLPIGISEYGASPDGRLIWYIKQLPAEGPQRLINPPRLGMVPTAGWGRSELHVLFPTGDDVTVDTSDSARMFVLVDWDQRSEALTFRRLDNQRELHRWSSRSRSLDGQNAEWDRSVTRSRAVGPFGGELKIEGFGQDRHLVEAGAAGKLFDYGHTNFTIGDIRASGAWLSPDGTIALLGTRGSNVPRYGLVRISRSGTLNEINSEGSLTNCSVNAAFNVGVCIQQSMTLRPQLVAFNPRSGGLRWVADLAPKFKEVQPLNVVARQWVSRDGFAADGFVIYPRAYNARQRYPAVFVTHGSDADDTFVNQGLQWDYPVQFWAEQGYFVVEINDPADAPSLSAASAKAFGTASHEKFDASDIQEVQDLNWIYVAHSLEDAAKSLVADGLIDANRIGIAGYSWGSQIVNVTMTQVKTFRAGSSGDGGFLEPSAYFYQRSFYENIYGGSPYEPSVAANYRRLAPTLRAREASGPLLQQVTSAPGVPQLELNMALNDVGVPSQISYYVGESHLLHEPKARLIAMTENIDWFDFWLRDRVDGDPAKAAQYRRWNDLRRAWTHGSSSPQ
jgi:dipeptidyl aminopeptidase/acylaminoacyl peptidase